VNPIDPAELSALLDGELPATRAAEVRYALATGADLHQQFEQLTLLDARWQAAAESLAFRPQVSPVPTSDLSGRWLLLGGVSVLVALRLATKMLTPETAIGLQVVALAAVGIWGLGWLLRKCDTDLATVAANRIGRVEDTAQST
jgi:anti-sigma factor RsiW